MRYFYSSLLLLLLQLQSTSISSNTKGSFSQKDLFCLFEGQYENNVKYVNIMKSKSCFEQWNSFRQPQHI